MKNNIDTSEIRVTCPHVLDGHLFAISDNARVFTQDPATIEDMLKRLNLPQDHSRMYAANLLEAGGDVTFHSNVYDAVKVVHDHYAGKGMSLDYR